MTPPQSSLTVLVQAALLIVLAGFLLVVGKPVLLPILAAVISVYVLVDASEALGRLPLIGRLPAALRRLLVLILFAVVVLAFAGVVVNTIPQILRQAPTYQANIERLAAQVANIFGLGESPDWHAIRAATIGRFSLQDMISAALLNVSSIGASLFFVIVYAAFLLGERAGFAA